MSWLTDIPGVKNVLDDLGITLPRRHRLRFRGSVSVQDNPATGCTDVTIGGTSAVSLSDPYNPATYLPPGVTVAAADAAASWHLWIAAAIAATGTCVLESRVYRTGATITLPSNSSLSGRGPLSEIQETAGFVGPALQLLNASNVRVSHLTLNGSSLQVDVALCYAASPKQVAFDGVRFVNAYSSAARSLQWASVHTEGDTVDLTFNNCYWSQAVGSVATTGKLVGLECVANNAGQRLERLRVTNCVFDAQNMTTGIQLEGYRGGIKELNVSGNMIVNAEFHALQIGYYLILGSSRDRLGVVYGNVMHNCGGAGISLVGADPTGSNVNGGVLDSQSRFFTVVGNTVDSCGGYSDGPFACGITSVASDVLISGNYITNIGYNSAGIAREFVNNCIGILMGATANQSHQNAAVTGNVLCKVRIGMSFDAANVLTISGNNLTQVYNGIGVTANNSSSSGWAHVNITGNSIDCLAGGSWGMYLYGYPGSGSRFHATSNAISGATSGVRVENVEAGVVQGNSFTFCTNGVLSVGTTINFLHTRVFIQGNYVSNTVDAAHNISTTAGASWLLAGKNFVESGCLPSVGSGPNPERVFDLQELAGPAQRTIIATAAPTSGQLPGGAFVGDRVMLVTPSAGVYGYLCTSPGNPGTWKALNYTP
jgi:hypothetical protein